MSSRYSTDFLELGKLGKGGFGTVFKCKNKLDEKEYAVKKIPFKDGPDGQTNREKVLREVLALSTMDHCHVVRKAWIEDGCTVEQSSSEEESSSEDSANATLYIQMKFCPETLHGLLESLRVSDTVLDSDRVWRLFRQLVEGVRYIHSAGFVHRDLTRSNIFFDENNNVQIGDFGLATFVPDMSSGVTVTGDDGNLLYMAPELKMEDAQVSDKADMFSLGLVLCDLLFQFSTDSERAKIFAILRRGGELPAVWEAPHPIVAELLALTPSARPSASQVLQRQLPWKEVGLEYVHELEDTVRVLQTQVASATSEIEGLKKLVSQLPADDS
ncbi:hypothetical protein Vadar_003356 [Vaccinium darrowii]|uniref:Uncharacterized protein n=1 Tax=Vaccinium darrowii TaxID=229202 RepID=A0ACB7YB82_9ERIC|nr:hypothetical protein Vadar_003356 [Vaccinium darrowii]